MAWPLSLVGLVGLVGCANEAPPAYPHTTVEISTDLPIPAIVSHLRIDVFEASGVWRQSRQFALRDASDYPASFALSLGEETGASEVLVRVRLYPDGAERDYLGERFRPSPPDDAAPDYVEPDVEGDGLPRLTEDGVDATPPTEPSPDVSVDRLLRVKVGGGAPERMAVTLRGVCMGRMANLAEASSCIDADQSWAPASTISDTDGALASTVGSIATDLAAEAPPVHDGAVPIRGGVFILGGNGVDVGNYTDLVVRSSPARLALVHSFAMDRDEVSVSRLRDALRRGFAPSLVVHVNDAPLGSDERDPSALCTYRTEPDPNDPERETMPATCIAWDVAAEFCAFEGGALPTEAQWEYAATMSGRTAKTRYPWGDDAPSCGGTIFGRMETLKAGSNECRAEGAPFGLRDANGASGARQDVTVDGVRNLAGSVGEWVQGKPLPYDAACWVRSGLVDPACDAPIEARSLRGGTWGAPLNSLVSELRNKVPASGSSAMIGFRCVYAR